MHPFFLFRPFQVFKRLHLAISFSFFCSFLVGQVSTFRKTYGTAGDDEARFIHVLPDNTFLLAGSTTMGNQGGTDALLIKLDANGDVLWSSTFGGASSEYFKFILPCSDGSFIAYGETRSFGSGGTDLYLVKFDTNGNLIWSRTYGGSNDELATGGLCETADGYVVSGATQSFGAGFWDIYVIKIGFTGNIIWTRRWGTGGGDGGGEPLLAENGDVWVSGGCYVSNNNHNGILLRIQANGILAESKLFGGPTNEGNEFLSPGGAGMTASSHVWQLTENGLQQQPWMVSYTSDGHLVWSRRYLISDGNYQINAENCPDSGFIFAPNRNGDDNDVAYLIKTNQNGDVTWSFSYSYDGTGDMYHAMPCPDGGYVAVGYRNGAGRDIFLIKTNENGVVMNCRPENADIRSLATIPNILNRQFVTNTAGFSSSQNSQSAPLELTQIPICSASGTSVYDMDQPIKPLVISPNPAYNFIQIQTPSGADNAVRLLIYNVLGECLFRGQITRDERVDVSSLPVGYYVVLAEDASRKFFQGSFIKH